MMPRPRAETFFAVVNPAAGGGRCGRRAGSAIDQLREAGLTVAAQETAAPGDGLEFVRQAWSEGFRRFLAVGGDGTSWEVLNGLMPLQLETGDDACLGFLPLGTGNSFLRDFSSDGAAHALRSLIEDHRRRCDVLCLHHREGRIFFINLLGWGFVTEVAGRAVRHKGWGTLGYILAVLQSLLRHRSTTVSYRCDDYEMQGEAATLVCVCNSRYTGGAMMMAPDARVDDGMTDVVQAGPLGRMAMLGLLPRIFSGAHMEHPAVTSRQVRKIEFSVTHALALMIDGELVEVVPEAIEVLPRALEIWA